MTAPLYDNSKMYRLKEPVKDKEEHDLEAPHDVVLSFDTTASMAPFIKQLRTDLKKFINQIFAQHSDTRIAIIAHGDYTATYAVKIEEFTKDVDKLQQFVKVAGDTDGGDYAECYEFVLWTAKKLKWRDGAVKQLIMFGDAFPHDFEDFPRILNDPGSRFAKHQLDWRDEADDLLRMGVSIFPMQYDKGKCDESDRFWAELAYKTKSWLMEVDNPEEVRAVITIAIYKGKGTNCLMKHIEEVTLKGEHLPDSLKVNLLRLQEEAGSKRAIAFETLRSPPSQCVEEDEAASERRKAAIAADRLSRGVIVTSVAKDNAMKRIKDMERDLEKKDREIKDLHEKLQNLKSEKDQSLREIRELEGKLESNNKEALGRVQAKDKELEGKDSEIEKLKEEIQRKEADIKIQSSKLIELEMQLSAKQEELEDRDNELKNKISEVGDLNMEKDKLENSLAEQKKISEAQNIRIKKLEEDLETMKNPEITGVIVPENHLSINQDSAALSTKERTSIVRGMYKGSMKVAVKKMEISDPIGEENLKMFMKDIHLLEKTRHPNLIVVYGLSDPFISPECLTVVMELAENCLQKTSLSKNRSKRLSSQTLVRILMDAADGLSYLHSLDKIHGAVKPSNIMIVGKAGKLSDIGLSSLSRGEISQYTAPELKDDPATSTKESDVYAFGVTILETFTGENQKKDQLLNVGGVANKKRPVITQCTEKNPSQRIKSDNISRLLAAI